MDFPVESVELARDVVRRYKDRGNSRRSLAVNLYNGSFIEIGYGFGEALKTGRCGKYFHEIKKEADCFTKAGVLYLVAREAGLHPEMFFSYGTRDVQRGHDPLRGSRNNHAFITVDGPRGKRFIVDPFMSLFGEFSLDEEENKIVVTDRAKVTERTYRSMEHLTQEEYLERLEANRTPEGGRIALSATQKVRGPRGTSSYVDYFSESSQLRSSLHFKQGVYEKDPLENSSITDLVCDVSPDGSFDFESGDIRFYYAVNAGWTEHEGTQEALVLPVSDLRTILGSMDETYGLKRKAPIDYTDPYGTYVLLKELGLEFDFSIREDTSLDDLVREDPEIESHFERARDFVAGCCGDYVQRALADEPSARSLFRTAHYFSRSREATSPENPLGFVFSEEERLDVLRRSLQMSHDITDQNCVNAKKAMSVFAGVSPGRNLDASRKFRETSNRFEDDLNIFDYLCELKKDRSKHAYDLEVDNLIFHRAFDLDRPLDELRGDLSDADLVYGAQARLFSFLINTANFRRTLFLPSYHRGLQRLLDTTS